MTNSEKVERLKEIRNEIESLVLESVKLLPEEDMVLSGIIQNEYENFESFLILLEDSIPETENSISYFCTVITNSELYKKVINILNDYNYEYVTDEITSIVFAGEDKDAADSLEADLTDLLINYDIHLDFDRVEL